jgi:hypothetical protein
MDHENWVFNLEEANESGQTEWYKLYNMKEAYGMTDLSPASYDHLATQMISNDTLWDMYLRYIRIQVNYVVSIQFNNHMKLNELLQSILSQFPSP